jgi:antiviral helicase SLH1
MDGFSGERSVEWVSCRVFQSAQKHEADFYDSRSSDQDISVDPELLEISNAPSLLDFYPNAGPSRLRGMASDVGTTSDLGVGSSSQQNGAASLMSRLQRYDRVHDFKADARQLPVSSSFDSLASILASSRSNEDIQLELVELLGFEGEGLQLVEEILRHGVRQDVVAQLTTQAGRPTRSASPPKVSTAS